MRTLWTSAQLLGLLALTLAYDTPPSIVTQPVSLNVDARSKFTLTCSAQGTPPPTYSWKKNGEDYVIETGARVSLNGGNLVVQSPTADDNGQYQCFANNYLGTSMSDKVNVTLSFLGQFRDSAPASRTVDLGEPLTLRCGADFGPPDGKPDPYIYWTNADPKPAPIVYDARVNQDPEGNLVFANVIASDAQGYYCTAFNTIIGESKVSPKITISVNSNVQPSPLAAHLLSTPGSSVTALRTESLVVKCIAEGYPTPEIVWKRGGVQLLSDGNRITIDAGGQGLTISDITFDDSGSYVCEATNAGGLDTFTTVVTVEAAPYFATPPSDETKGPGESVTINCIASGVPVPTVDLLVNGQPWADFEASFDTGSRYTVVTGSSKKASITITGLQTTDSKVFQCLATNKYKETLTSVVLNVVAIPAIIQEFVPASRELVVFQDGAASLGCVIDGRPWPTIVWTFKGTQLTAGSKYAINDQEGTLVISDMVEADSGTYTCTITNSIDGDVHTATDSARIEVIAKTEISLAPQDASVQQGENALFQCEITYDVLLESAPEVYWMKDGTRHAASTDNSLSVSDAQIENSGTYTCVVETPIGGSVQMVNASAVLTVRGRPSPPMDLELNSGEQQFVYRLMWSPGSDNNEPITQFIIQYDTEWENRHWVEKSIVTADGSADYITIVSLDPYVRYSFRIIAVNALGQSDPSEVKAMDDRTAPAPPTRNPENPTGRSDDPASIVIRWEPVEPYYYGGEDFKYLVKYRVQGSGDEYTEEEVYPPTKNLIIEASKPYEFYEFTVQSMNNEGVGPVVQEPQVGNSGEASPAAAPGNVNVVSVSPSELNVTWDPISAQDANGALLGYYVYYNRRIASGQDRVQCMNAGCIVSGLEAFSTYEVFVKAYTGGGEGPASPTVTITTMQAPPGPVRLKVEAFSYRLTMKWDPPIEVNGILGGYKISMAPMTEETIGDWRNFTVSVDDPRSLRLEDDIEPETKYRIEVVAHNGMGEGARTVEEPTTMLAGKPAQPPMPDVKNLGMNNVTFTWDLSAVNPTPQMVKVQYKKDDDESVWISTQEVDVLDESEIMVSGLESTTQYVAMLVTKNPAGMTSGKPTQFKTSGTDESTDPGFVMGTWLIILICVIIFLILILLIICIIKSQKGGKYNVSDKEKQLNKDIESTPLKPDGFDEYTPPGDGEPHGSQDSLVPSEPGSSETDSLKEYADGDMGKFDEEGSFIGQYGDNKKQKPAEDGEPGGGAAYSTFV